jgi:hypothetical protein
MELYIANPTKQSRRINFRLDTGRDGSLVMDPRFRYHRSIDVPAGKTVTIPGLEHVSQCDSIMRQLEKFGARQTTEKNRLPRAVVPYLMSVNEPISPRMIAEVAAHNHGIKSAEGSNRRKAAAIAATDAIAKAVEEQQDAQGEVRNPGVEFIQQPDPETAEQPGAVVSEAYRVSANAPVENNRGNARRGGRRANS